MLYHTELPAQILPYYFNINNRLCQDNTYTYIALLALTPTNYKADAKSPDLAFLSCRDFWFM